MFLPLFPGVEEAEGPQPGHDELGRCGCSLEEAKSEESGGGAEAEGEKQHREKRDHGASGVHPTREIVLDKCHGIITFLVKDDTILLPRKTISRASRARRIFTS